MRSSAKPREHLRALMTTDAVGGVWQYSLDLAAGLAQRGADVLLATLGPRPSAAQKRYALRIPRLVLAESDFALEWAAEPWADVDAAGEWLLRLQSNFGADVIHLNGYAHAALAWRKPVVVVAHSCVYSWWGSVYGTSPGNEWNEYYCLVRAGLSTAHAIVAPSVFMADELHRIYGVTSEKVQVIHNFSRARGLSENSKQPFVLAAGRFWDPAKNIGLLDRIAPELEWEVRVAGNEPGCANSVKPLGVLLHSKLIAQMRRASIFAHPALYEPFGLAILEAALSRCCLVIADIPSLRELWGGSAILIDPRDPDRWIFELNTLARDPAKVQEFGRKARARAKNFRFASALGKYWKLYRSLPAFTPEAGRVVAA
jgi:glycogen(starch) synthase